MTVMMRRRWPLLLIATLCAVLFFLPMRVALGWVENGPSGVSATRVSGTIWGGRAEQVSIAALPLGALDLSLDPLRLPLGRARMQFERSPGAAGEPLAGAVETGWGRRALVDVSGTVAGPANSNLPISAIRLTQFNALFVDGECNEASGSVQATLGITIAGLDLRNGLSGTASCQGGALILPLVGQSGLERMTMTLRGDGRYEARISIRADDPLLAAALVVAGLQPTNDGFGLTIRGQY